MTSSQNQFVSICQWFFNIKFILVTLIIVNGFLYLTNPKGLVINTDGKVEGTINKLRADLQFTKFWKLQLKKAETEYEKCSYPEEYPSLEQRKILQIYEEKKKIELEASVEYESQERHTARLLRLEADIIEVKESFRVLNEIMEKSRLESLEKMEKIIPILKSKILIEDNMYVRIALAIYIPLLLLLSLAFLTYSLAKIIQFFVTGLT